MRPADHPVDIAVLRAVMLEPERAFTQAALVQAVSWLGESKHATTKSFRPRLGRLVERGLLVVSDDPDLGRLWAFKIGSSVRLATGGIDPLTVTPDEALTAYAWRSGASVEYDPNAHRRTAPGQDRTTRAMRQVSSPWQYADRLRRL